MQKGRSLTSPAHKRETLSRSGTVLQHDRLDKVVQCNRLIRWLLTPMLCLLFFALPAHVAAQVTSVIQGTIVDSQGRAVTGAQVSITGPLIVREIKDLSDLTGSYRLGGLQPGTYQLRVTKPGFAVQVYEGLVLTVNRILTFDIALAVSAIQAEVIVSSDPPLLDNANSFSGTTILPQQIEEMPINGRNYLDLLQLVPGVAFNRQVDPGTDAAVPILGERSGNTVFLIDGMPNSNAVNGGPAAPFDQDSILEFQVLTAGYKAEFGHGSGGVVNVVTKRGTNQWHGRSSLFHRNSVLDSSNVSGKTAPFLLRWDPSANLSGPLLKGAIFFFGSVERIREIRQLNFSFPSGIPDFLEAREKALDKHSQIFQTRGFARLDEELGRHHFTEEMNLSNSHVTGFQPLSQATSSPSTRIDSSSRQLMLGIRDTATVGRLKDPFLLQVYLQYRSEPSLLRATNAEDNPATTLFNLFSSLTTGRLTGDLGQVRFGAGFSPSLIKQRYISAGLHVNKVVADHDFKFGWDFQRTHVDGQEATNQLNQLFATVSDFAQFGSVNSGVYVLSSVSGPTPSDNIIRLRNFYNGLFAQDDWKIARSVTVNVGLRWDYDSRFANGGNFSPRLGVAWSPTPKTVVTASWGMFYDKFRLGLARDIPGLGGANLFRNQTISYPRLFYGNPSTLPRLFGLCPSTTLTDAQIQAAGATCPIAGLAFVGIDHLNTGLDPLYES